MHRFLIVTFVLAVVVGLLASSATADDIYVSGYYRSNGTYVAPHYRSNPDGNFYNNWSTYPNINPYTGAIGRRYYPSYDSYSYPRYRSYSYPRYRSYSYPRYRYR